MRKISRKSDFLICLLLKRRGQNTTMVLILMIPWEAMGIKILVIHLMEEDSRLDLAVVLEEEVKKDLSSLHFNSPNEVFVTIFCL
jgi:hypothetical protein